MNGVKAEDRSRADWRAWSDADTKRRQLAEYEQRLSADGGTYPIEIAKRLAERNLRTAPDFYLVLSQDRWLLDRLVRKLPLWDLVDVRELRQRRDTVERALTSVAEREALRELIDGYDRIALAYAAAGYLAGFEAGKLRADENPRRVRSAERPDAGGVRDEGRDESRARAGPQRPERRQPGRRGVVCSGPTRLPQPSR